MSDERLFGTDGIRGRAGEGWLAPPRVSALGRSIGAVLAAQDGEERPRRALLGHDGRWSGPELEAALARGLATQGYGVTSAGLITTPGLATLGHLRGFDVAVMLSASHNPAHDNGIKVFQKSGEKLTAALEREVEAHVQTNDTPVEDGSPPALDPALEAEYQSMLLAGAGDLELSGMRVAVDCANGGGSRVAPRVLGRLGAQVIASAVEPDGGNINADCGATDLANLQEEVHRGDAVIGVALDGDGDRCMLVDERGAVVNGDAILTVLGRFHAARGELDPPRVVATVMSNRGLHRALREVGIEVRTCGVGDQRVVEEMLRSGAPLGGEQSGHVIFGPELGQKAACAYVGDGIRTALCVLRVLRETGEPLSALASPYSPYPQVLVNVAVRAKLDLAKIEGVAALVRETEDALGEDGRVLIRYSGTEPLARVMVEGPDEPDIRARATSIAAAIEAALGSGV